MPGLQSEFGHDVLFLEVAVAMDKVLYVPEVLMRWRVYSSASHAWTKALEGPPRARTPMWKRIFPPDLAENYRSGEGYYRKHSVLLSCMLRDFATFGGSATAASGRLTKLMNLMAMRADVMKLRARFYGTLSRMARMRLMLQGAAMGQYRNAEKGGVGIHNALRDMLAILLQQPRPM